MVQVAKGYMEKMGINDTQYVIVRHHNTPNPHCHLIFNRVDNNGKRISDSKWLKRNVRVCKELKQKYGLTLGEGKSQTRTERLRPNERMRYEMAKDVKSALKDSHSRKGFSNNLKSYDIKAEIKFRIGTNIPQGISFTRNGTTFKGSSLDRSLSFSRIDKILTGGMNIDNSGQSQDPSAHEFRSHEPDHSLISDLANIASELAIGLIASGQEKKSEEDFALRKKARAKIIRKCDWTAGVEPTHQSFRPASVPDHDSIQSHYHKVRIMIIKQQTIMAKQYNPFTELQALEGIYEHLSTIDDLAKEVGAISTRL